MSTLTERITLHERALALHRERGIGYELIARELNIPKGTVGKWLYGKSKPLGRHHIPNLNPSPELSYIIGVVHGDGIMYKERGKDYKIGLSAKDRDFVEEFNRCISRVLGKRKPYPLHPERGGRWGFAAVSVFLYQFLEEWDRCCGVINQYPAEFVRGFFDSEGGAYKNSKYIILRYYNTNKELL